MSHHRNLLPDADREYAECDRQDIGRRYRRNPEQSAAEETDDIALQTLFRHLDDPSEFGILNCELVTKEFSPRIRGIP